MGGAAHMSDAPIYNIDPDAFWRDPYPDLKRMSAQGPVVFVPQLGATLLTRRDDIFENEKKVDVFSFSLVLLEIVSAMSCLVHFKTDRL